MVVLIMLMLTFILRNKHTLVKLTFRVLLISTLLPICMLISIPLPPAIVSSVITQEDNYTPSLNTVSFSGDFSSVANASATYGIDPAVLIAIAATETGGQLNNDASGAAGEEGVFQIMPNNLRNFCNIPDWPTVDEGALCAAKLIAQGMEQGLTSPQKIASAYNAGWPAVLNCGCIPNQHYVNIFNGWYDYYSSFGGTEELGGLVSGWHGSVDGWWGYDYVAGRGSPIYSPLTGTVTSNGTDGYVGPYSIGVQNTLLIIDNGTDKRVALLHGQYTVTVGQFVIRGEQIGTEDSIGNTVNNASHTHYVMWLKGNNTQ